MSFDKDAFKKASNPFKPKDVIKGSLSGDPGNIFRTGRTQAKKQQAKQSLMIEKQQQKEALNLAESEDEIARRKSIAKSGKAGRKSLIATGGTGTKSTNLGGTL